jgi:hypothetical protein
LTTVRSNPDKAVQKQLAEDVNRQFAKECWIIPKAWVIWGIVSAPDVAGLGEATFPDGTTPRADGEGFPGQMNWGQVYRTA